RADFCRGRFVQRHCQHLQVSRRGGGGRKVAGCVKMNEAFTADELRDLRRAKSLLENRSFAIKLSDLFGMPINAGFALLPKKWSGKINRVANAALFKALEVAVATTGRKGLKSPSNRWH